VARGRILGFSIDFLRRLYNTLALPCECVISGAFREGEPAAPLSWTTDLRCNSRYS